MSLLLVGSGNSPLQSMADFLRDTFHQEVHISYSPQMALRHLQSPHSALPDVLLADISGQSLTGAENFLHAIQGGFPDLPILVMTTLEQSDAADQLLRVGAMDILPKPVNRSRARLAVVNALRVRSLRQEVQRLRLHDAVGQGLQDIVARSHSMQAAIVAAKQATQHTKPLWLHGEHGTGKEMLARAILNESAQAGGPFIRVNCAGKTEDTLEQLLFGGAAQRGAGAMRRAENGVLYLDEIEHLSPRILAMLSQWIKISDGVEIAPASVAPLRIVASTRRCMEHNNQSTAVQQLLAQHWCLAPLALPPLRERQEDILELAQHHLSHYARMEGRPVPQLDSAACEWLQSHRWPGNLPELARCLHMALWLADGQLLSVNHLEGGARRAPGVPSANCMQPGARMQGEACEHSLAVLSEDGALRSLAEIEEEMLHYALRFHRGCMARVARDLGIGRSTLYRKLQASKPESASGVSPAGLMPQEENNPLRKGMA